MSNYWNQFSKSAKSFVEGVDPNVQKQIEVDIEQGKISEKNLNVLEQKQEEIRNKIENSGIEMTVVWLGLLIATASSDVLPTVRIVSIPLTPVVHILPRR